MNETIDQLIAAIDEMDSAIPKAQQLLALAQKLKTEQVSERFMHRQLQDVLIEYVQRVDNKQVPRATNIYAVGAEIRMRRRNQERLAE